MIWKTIILVALFIALMVIVVLYVVPAVNCGDNCLRCDHFVCSKCVYGWYGIDCTRKCQGCEDTCDKETGICNQCQSEYFSDGCNKACPVNCRVSFDGVRHCYRDSGRCQDGCVPGRWGHQCQKLCPSYCEMSSCHQEAGTCLLGCTDGWFGQLCDKPCPENCLGNTCNLVQGYCGHCKPGFIGPKCDIRCRNCVDDTCTYNELLSSVSCTRGCERGWTGEDCQSPCSNRCLDVECNMDGTCKKCPDGYYGDKCTVPCASSCRKCEQTTGICTLKRNGRYPLKETSNVSPTKSPVKSSRGSFTVYGGKWTWIWILATICYGVY